jgi:threonine dehydrogenase-like Zn-dependent dehydrogenase
VKPGENVLVVGAGPVGMGAAQFALAAGGNVCCLDINDQRLEFVRDNVGVKHIVNAIAKEGEPDSIEKLKAIFGGDLPTCVIEATGSKFSMEKAFEFVASGGRICFVGFIKGQITYDNPLFHQREMTIMGSRNALGRDFAHTIKMIEDGKVDVTPWVTHTCKFDDFEENFKTWLDPATGVIKALVIMDE